MHGKQNINPKEYYKHVPLSPSRPIHDAIEIGSLDLVKLLIDHNADLTVEYGERTAVEFAIDQDQIEIAEYIKGGQL